MKEIKPILQYFEEEYEYPSNEQLLHGIQQGVLFSYVASTYLQGFINYVDIEAAVLLNRYSETDEEFQKQIDSIKKEVAEQNEVHTYLYDYDDILILGKTDDMYIVFWSDGDVSDCNIGGLPLDTFESLSDAIEALYKEAEYLVADNVEVKDYYKIPVEFFSGWITL